MKIEGLVVGASAWSSQSKRYAKNEQIPVILNPEKNRKVRKKIKIADEIEIFEKLKV